MTDQELCELGYQIQEAINAAADAISGTHEAMLLLMKALAQQPSINVDQLACDFSSLVEDRYRVQGSIPAAVVNANAQLARLQKHKT